MMTCVGRLIFCDLPVNSAGQNGSTIFGERLKRFGQTMEEQIADGEGFDRSRWFFFARFLNHQQYFHVLPTTLRTDLGRR